MALDYIHHNLQTGRVSVREGGQPGGARRVTIEADWALIRDARPNVSAAGWKRSRTAAADGGAKRSVHADIRGRLDEHGHGTSREELAARLRRQTALRDELIHAAADWRRITYNPNRHEPGAVPVFHYADTGEAWTGSSLVLVTGGYAYEVNR